MNATNAGLVSAQVILDPSFADADGAVGDCERAFAELGFDLGHRFAGSFAITASVQEFERAFRCRLVVDARGVRVAAGAGEPVERELPLAALPASCRAVVAAVTFGEPADFGPGSF